MSVMFALENPRTTTREKFVHALIGLLHGGDIDVPDDNPFEMYLLQVRSTMQ